MLHYVNQLDKYFKSIICGLLPKNEHKVASLYIEIQRGYELFRRQNTDFELARTRALPSCHESYIRLVHKDIKSAIIKKKKKSNTQLVF